MFDKIKRKLERIRDINIIRKSPYFDEAYYLENNEDVLKSKADPAAHYYEIGWKEGRNPSPIFNNNDYLNLNYKFKININPVLHYMKYGINQEGIIGPKTDFHAKVSKIIKTRIKEGIPFDTLEVARDNTRVNIVFNGFDKSCFFGGKATALLLSVMFANKYGYDVRIIAQNPDNKVFYDFLKLFNLESPKSVEFFSIDHEDYLEVSDKEIFICTMWLTAQAVLNTPTITGKVFYIMQEVETFFYDHGDTHLACFNTLTNDRLVPIVNSKLLYDYLVNNGYDNVKNNGIYFEPVFSRELLKASESSFSKKEKYKLFYYARPSHQRNLFYFGLDNLNEAFMRGVLDPKEWVVCMAGDRSIPNFSFDTDVEVEKLAVMDWNEYCKFLSTVDLCYSMIYTPHPSYPPLDSVTAGAVCVSNKYANKQDLSNYSKNIVTAKLDKEAMMEALGEGANLAKNGELRKQNYETSTTAGKWEDAFSEIIPYMNKFVGEDSNV